MAQDNLSDDELLSKLRAKYERPSPPEPCPTCGGGLRVEAASNGFPLRWMCAAAETELLAIQASDAEVPADLLAHLETSTWEDFRPVGDARVVELIARYERLKASAPSAEAANPALSS